MNNHGIPVRVIRSALVVASGPSAAGVDWSLLNTLPKGVCIISVNATLPHLPRVDYWFTCDRLIAEKQKDIKPCEYVACMSRRAWNPKKITLPPERAYQVDHILYGHEKLAEHGFSWDGTLPGHDSGYSAINLAAQMGATRIAVLGFDCGGKEWWTGDEPEGTYHDTIGRRGNMGAATAAAQCAERGIQVMNGSPDSQCTAWPRCTPDEALAWIAQRPDVLMLTGYDHDPGFAPIGDRSAGQTRAYARHFRLPCYVEREMQRYAKGRHIVWAKYPLIGEHLEGHDWVAWIDADAFCWDTVVDIRDYCDRRYDIIVATDSHGINAGIMLVRNTEWSKALLKRMWDTTQWLDREYREQSALRHLVETDMDVARHVKVIAASPLNVKPKQWGAGKDIIMHLMSADGDKAGTLAKFEQKHPMRLRPLDERQTGMSIKALVAVRGGSERVKNKNVRPFAGKNLLRLKIEQLKRIPELAGVVVNSDDPGMLAIAREMGVEAIEREPGLGGSGASMSEVYRSMAGQMDCDAIAYCNATSPLLDDVTIARCVAAYQPGRSANTTAAVKEFMWRDGAPVNYDTANQPRSQDLPDIQRISFACSVLAREDMVRWGNVVAPNPVLIETDAIEATDIDTPLDFACAEWLHRKTHEPIRVQLIKPQKWCKADGFWVAVLDDSGVRAELSRRGIEIVKDRPDARLVYCVWRESGEMATTALPDGPEPIILMVRSDGCQFPDCFRPWLNDPRVVGVLKNYSMADNEYTAWRERRHFSVLTKEGEAKSNVPVHLLWGWGRDIRVEPFVKREPSWHAPRSISAYFAGTVEYKHGEAIEKAVTPHRRACAQAVKSVGGVAHVGRVPRNQYLDDMHETRVVVSPWGQGEACFRDYEAALAGCVLIKPKTPWLQDWLGFYKSPQIVWCEPDWSDLSERVAEAEAAYGNIEARMDFRKRALREWDAREVGHAFAREVRGMMSDVGQMEAAAGETDAVILYREDGGTELPFCVDSLRKLAGGLGTIYVIGDNPNIMGVTHIPHGDPNTVNREANMIRKVLAACRDERISDPFLLCANDEILLAPIDLRDYPLPRTPHRETGMYGRKVFHTRKVVEKAGWPWAYYDGHTPILVHKAAYIEAMGKMPWDCDTVPGILCRTPYGCLMASRGAKAKDVPNGKHVRSRIGSPEDAKRAGVFVWSGSGDIPAWMVPRDEVTPRKKRPFRLKKPCQKLQAVV